MNADDRITLREHFDKIISIRFDAIDEKFQTVNQAQEKALKIAADELSRRLDILNHAHQQAMEIQEKFLPRELHEERVSNLEKRVMSVERMVWAVGGVAAFLAVIVPIIVRVMSQ